MTDELVQIILQPGLDPGAVDVFLEFICYSGGPLPEELLPLVKVRMILVVCLIVRFDFGNYVWFSFVLCSVRFW